MATNTDVNNISNGNATKQRGKSAKQLPNLSVSSAATVPRTSQIDVDASGLSQPSDFCFQ